MKLFSFALLSGVAVFLFTAFRGQETAFREIPASESGITIVNRISDVALHEKYVYGGNGNGIGVGDFNGDGLPDLFFSSNDSTNRLYLNRGNFHFEDVTEKSGVAGNGLWGSGVSVVDINADGLPDVYVCHSGPYKEPGQLENQLFINKGIENGVPHFEEEAALWGLSLPGSNSTQATFFDYDKDGDLDVFVLNHSVQEFVRVQPASVYRGVGETSATNVLLRNEGKRFVPVTAKAGIVTSHANFGLGVVVTDLNNDGWEDLYCTSDFEERDFCYINEKNGHFREVLPESFGHTSFYSMGVDAGDMDNDGRMDLVTVDMLPENNLRQKVILANEGLEKQLAMQRQGFHFQYVRNMLQVNTGADAKGVLHFSERGQMAGIGATDWSWSPLFLDYNNDGRRDLFITSGYARDIDMDVVNKFSGAGQRPKQGDTIHIDLDTPENKKSRFTTSHAHDSLHFDPIKLPSQLFRNDGQMRFVNNTVPMGLGRPTVAGACVYADFNNDGRIDILFSNLDEPPSLYANQASNLHYLTVDLKGSGSNLMAYGARVTVRSGSSTQVLERQPVRGYQSSQDPRLHFGLGDASTADIEVLWPDGTRSEKKGVATGQLIVLDYAKESRTPAPAPSPERFAWMPANIGVEKVRHQENNYIDFREQFTIPYMVSTTGPATATADLNGDGKPDYYLGGAKGSAGRLLLSTATGGLRAQTVPAFEQDRAFEDVAAVFVDADKDSLPDLYVASGGTEQGDSTQYYNDRLYLNKGKGIFVRAKDALPVTSASAKGVVSAADFDKDGDLDLFVGGYTVPGRFGTPPASYFLLNDGTKGKPHFTDITGTSATMLRNSGMVTGAQWGDWNKDGYPDLFVSAEWTNMRIYENVQGKGFVDLSRSVGLTGRNGLWSSLLPVDVDGDGDLDLLAGNVGSNFPIAASDTAPLKLFLADLNENGQQRAYVSYHRDGHDYPIYFRDEFLDEAPRFKNRYPTYYHYASVDMPQLLQKTDQIPTFETNRVTELRSGIFLNENGKMTFLPFPAEAQASRINAITPMLQDGKPSFLVSGNFYGNRMRFGKSDALQPVVLSYGDKQWSPFSAGRSGLFVDGQVRSVFAENGGQRLLFFINNDFVRVYERK